MSNPYKEVDSLLHLSARTLRQAYEKAREIDREFSEDLASMVFAAESHQASWRKQHPKQLADTSKG